jgi:hypothetical protein
VKGKRTVEDGAKTPAAALALNLFWKREQNQMVDSASTCVRWAACPASRSTRCRLS